MNRTFDTDVQLLKYKVLKAVSKRAFDGTLQDSYYEIPKEIIPGKQATMRCCVYKERAIVGKRVHTALGGDRGDSVIQVIDIAFAELVQEEPHFIDRGRRVGGSLHKNLLFQLVVFPFLLGDTLCNHIDNLAVFKSFQEILCSPLVFF